MYLLRVDRGVELVSQAVDAVGKRYLEAVSVADQRTTTKQRSDKTRTIHTQIIG